MNKTDFKNAFREAVASEFSQIPTDEESIDFTFSKRFNKQMKKLIRSQKKSYYSFVRYVYDTHTDYIFMGNSLFW